MFALQHNGDRPGRFAAHARVGDGRIPGILRNIRLICATNDGTYSMLIFSKRISSDFTKTKLQVGDSARV